MSTVTLGRRHLQGKRKENKRSKQGWDTRRRCARGRGKEENDAGWQPRYQMRRKSEGGRKTIHMVGWDGLES